MTLPPPIDDAAWEALRATWPRCVGCGRPVLEWRPVVVRCARCRVPEEPRR